ncbi:calcium uptake protein 2, mitochondrial [Polypterus senegalus]|uniref:calcium uptake protein 2, mitochondrial n=1 Tax=Polypterus senegalus TaxID=55291 RepID=UPI0019637C2F|nr:calcium uptake protein 2, mitochondrial [Polypterus senegalus]XP_039601377.1 calcium uptake protein 2, mitochondrial [Polypterus senegalus]
MATWGRVLVSLGRGFIKTPGINIARIRRTVGRGVLGSLLVGGALTYYQNGGRVLARRYTVQAAQDDKSFGAEIVSPRKLRFQQFASMEYNGEAYMTPRDFLFSIMLESVDRKLHKKKLTEKELDQMLTKASKAKPGSSLFRNLGDDGVISYNEYLFLLTILTKPHRGFHIAFKMLDVDGNEHVDKNEFLKLKNIIGNRKETKLPKNDTEDSPNEDEATLTSLQAYFFGKGGKRKLQYTEFCSFMENLQIEMQEMEFLQFSKGMDTMRREDFAEWLLHYTNEENNEAYWENMRKRIPPGQSISFEEFKSFCLFTNNLEDFAFTLKMISEANRPIGIAEFKRAVMIATGNELSDNVLDTVFKLFDLDGDNCLSHKEFLEVMDDRVRRGLKVQNQQGIQGYWKCVKKETLKGAQEALRKAGRSPF